MKSMLGWTHDIAETAKLWDQSQRHSESCNWRKKVRNSARLRLGHYPLAIKEAERTRRFLQFPDAAECSVLDPCAGCGTALVEATQDSHTTKYGIELDAYHAEQAGQAHNQVIQGNCFDVRCPVESFSLLHHATPSAAPTA